MTMNIPIWYIYMYIICIYIYQYQFSTFLGEIPMSDSFILSASFLLPLAHEKLPRLAVNQEQTWDEMMVPENCHRIKSGSQHILLYIDSHFHCMNIPNFFIQYIYITSNIYISFVNCQATCRDSFPGVIAATFIAPTSTTWRLARPMQQAWTWPWSFFGDPWWTEVPQWNMMEPDRRVGLW